MTWSLGQHMTLFDFQLNQLCENCCIMFDFIHFIYFGTIITQIKDEQQKPMKMNVEKREENYDNGSH